MRVPVLLLGGIAAFAFPALPQGAGGGGGGSVRNGVVGGMGFPARLFYAGPPITGAPYSAERVSEHVQVAADGTRFTQETLHEKLYRDSEGRSRTERPIVMGPNAPVDVPMIVDIMDPVANVGYVLDTQNKVAHRVPLQMSRTGAAPQQSGPPAIVAPDGSRRPMPQRMEEDLGQQMIAGVMAEGHRFTQTFPAGSQGSDRPFQLESETWYSPEIHGTVLSKTKDPRFGETTTKLINISRTEPDPSLFQPPPDYSVVNETAPFQIQWTAARQ